MEKYASALLELAKASKAVREINSKIGEALSASYAAWEATLPECDWSARLLPADHDEKWGKRNQHLVNAYKQDHEHGEWYYVNHDDDVRGYLAEHCEHALRAMT